jgi:PAS domain S-box-containing protein
MRDITERTVMQSALQAVVGSMVGTTGLNSLQKIVETVSSWLGVDCVMVGEIQPDGDTVKVLSMILDGKQVNDFIYHLKGTPCENVAEKGFCHYPDDSVRLFPGAKDIIDLNIQGYVGTPLWNSQGKVSGILCALSRKPLQLSPSVREILDTIAVKAAAEVERNRIEGELRESQRMVEKAMDLANLVNWEMDLKTGLLKLNDRFYALYGTSAEREGGYLMTPEKYIGEFVPPEDREIVATVFEGGPPPSSDPVSEFQMEHRIIRRDGGIRTIIVRVGILQDSGGQDIIVHGANQDITDRKRAEYELQKSQYLLAEAMDMAHMADWELDASTGVFTFNDRFYALYGTTAEREGGYQVPAEVYAREFNHPDDQHMVGEEIAKALSTPDSGYFALREHRIIRRDGEVRWIAVRIRITKDAEGRTIKTHGANQDITDRKKAEEALIQANNKLNLLSGITRHDINNQLLSLNGFVSLLQRDLSDTSHKKYFSRITEASKNIADMIEFTKEYENIGTGALVWQDLTSVINTAGKGLIPEKILLKNGLDATTEAFADPMMLEKVFFNLIDNAVRHGERVTEIRVSSHHSGEDLVVVWEDNGVGIAADEKELIFERGFGKNTGLGMFLVREILSLTGITFAEAGEPGVGARFEITIPHGSWRITR